MPDKLPQESPSTMKEPKVEDADRGHGHASAGAHLTRRQDRNADATEAAQKNPSGGAHSGSPDNTNP